MTRKLLRALILLLLVLCGCALLMPWLQPPLEFSDWQRSASALAFVGKGIIDYHKRHGMLPPAVKYAKDGTPLYSWRVLVLPFLEQIYPTELRRYKLLKLDEPWDSPHNKQFLDRRSDEFWKPFFRRGDDPVGTTRYQLLVGPGTAFERPGLTFKDFPDGLENTILAVEASEPVPWTKPADLVYDPEGPLPAMECEFSQPVHFLRFEVGRNRGFNAVFADGQTRFIRSDTDEKLIRALITRNGGEKVTRADLP